VRLIAIFLLMSFSAAAGYFIPALLKSSNQSDVELAFPDHTFRASSNLGCKVVTEGRAFEDRLGHTANAHAGTGTEKLALILSTDRKTLSVLYAYDVGIGATEPIPLDVHSNTSSYIVAAGQQTLGETAVILDWKTLKAVVSFTGQGMIGIKGSSYLVQCS
jgi:hypothetical protein